MAAQLWFLRPALLVGLMAWTIGPAFVELVTVSAGRIDAPFDLEWMEGIMLIEARRFWSGAGLYTAPDFEYIPLIYPPLYFLLLGPVMPFEPAMQYLLARLVSLACLVATQYCLWRICVTRYGWPTALVVAAVPLTFFAPSGFWLDNIRIDNLYLLAIFLSCGVLLAARSISAGKRVLISSLLFVAAIFGKQSSLVLLPALVIYWLIAGQVLRAVQQLVLVTLLTAGSLLMAQLWSGGYFWEYVWVVGRSHGYYYDSFRVALIAHIRQQYFNFTYLDELQCWIAVGALLGFVIAGRHIRKAMRRPGGVLRAWLDGCLWPARIQVDGFLGAVGCGLLVMTAMLSTHVGSYWNNNLPGLYGFLLLALVSARLVAYSVAWGLRLLGRRLRGRSEQNDSPLIKNQRPGQAMLTGLRWVTPVLLLWMAAQNYSTPLRQFMSRPELTAEMRAERLVLNGLIERAGPVLYPEQPPAAYLSGVPHHYHSMALDDLRKRPNYQTQNQLTSAANLDTFRFALSWHEKLRYPGFVARPIERIGLRPLLLRFPVGVDFAARYVFIRADAANVAQIDAELTRLRDMVAELRVEAK